MPETVILSPRTQLLNKTFVVKSYKAKPAVASSIYLIGPNSSPLVITPVTVTFAPTPCDLAVNIS